MCRAVSWIDEHGRAFVVGCAVCTGPAHLGPFPVGIALVSGVSHCPFSFFLRLKAGCRCNRVCLSGEERDGEVGGTRSEERRVGNACVSSCRSRCSPYHSKHLPLFFLSSFFSFSLFFLLFFFFL